VRGVADDNDRDDGLAEKKMTIKLKHIIIIIPSERKNHNNNDNNNIIQRRVCSHSGR